MRKNIFIQPIIGRARFAKVDGPLFSLEARGKIGDAMVFFPWKGRHAVRRWLKPTNPRDIDQKIIRQKLASLGHVLKAMVTPSTAVPNGAAAVVEIKTLTPAAQIWNAFLVKKGMDYFKSENNFTVFHSAITNATDWTSWTEAAVALDIPTIYATDDKYATDIEPGVQLAMAAYGAYAMDYSDGVIDMSIDPTVMPHAAIAQFASQLTNA